MEERAFPDLKLDFLEGQLSGSPLWNLREVDDGLFVGGHLSPLWSGFDTIIDLTGQDDPVYDNVRVALHMPFRDGEAVPTETLESSLKAAREAQGPVLIHCAEGRSRSVSVAYMLLRDRGLEHTEALRRVRSRFGPPMRATFDSARVWIQTR